MNFFKNFLSLLSLLFFYQLESAEYLQAGNPQTDTRVTRLRSGELIKNKAVPGFSGFRTPLACVTLLLFTCFLPLFLDLFSHHLRQLFHLV